MDSLRSPLPFPFPLFLFTLFLASACANPVAPSGGPRDETPPVIENSDPEAEAVNVEADAIEITFSEYVDQASFARAVSLTPAFETPVEFDWSGRTVTITPPEPLRDTTTYILTIDTDLRDERGVTLAQPITLAFSTGPRINRGRLAGRVVGAQRGSAQGGLDVYAYPAPDSAAPFPLPERPAYRTQTNPQGTFRFEYLREQPYYIVAMADRNRNRQPDPLEALAVPPRPALRADSSGRPDSTLQWVATARDTIPPALGRVQALSQSRLLLRFSEPVRLASENAAAAWSVRDSLRNESRPVRAAFQPPGTRQEIVLRTDPLRPQVHVLRAEAGAVEDSSGTALPPARASFIPPETPDTVQTRLLRFVPEGLPRSEQGAFLLPPGVEPGLQLNQPADTVRLRAALSVRDTTGQPRSFALRPAAGGATYRFAFSPPLASGDAAQVRVAPQEALNTPGDTAVARRFQRLSDRDLGELSGPVSAAQAPIVVELFAENEAGGAPVQRVQVEPGGRFLFARLPETSFRFRAFVDVNENGRWDGGQIAPYVPAEPIAWSDQPVSIRPRWETALEDTLRVPGF